LDFQSGEIEDYGDGCRDKEQSLGGDSVRQDSGPHEIQEQTATERGQIHTKDDEEFSSEKVISARSESKVRHEVQ
jgi:hypothetical protein